MNFWQVFVRVFPWRPFAALAALWWHITGRRVRAKNRLRSAGGELPFAYNLWMRNVEQAERFNAASHLQHHARGASFTVIIEAFGGDELALSKSLRLVQAQHYAKCDIIILRADGPALTTDSVDSKTARSWDEAVRESAGEFIVPLAAGDQLSEWALFHFANAAAANPGAVIVYGDEDVIDDGGRRRRPFFKPRWNKELLLSSDYVSRSCAIRTASLRSTLPKAEPCAFLDLILQGASCEPFEAVHIPRVLTHRPSRESERDTGAAIDAVARHVAATGATAGPGPFGTVKVSWPLPAHLPLVSIVIPTKDRPELLRACIDTILTGTDYSPFELIVIDNRSVEARTLEYLDSLSAQPNIGVLRYPGAYNYSAINNFAVRNAAGTFVCLLNNDTEVVTPEWLTEMMRYAVRSDIGAVGAKLLYPDGTIQHAGVVVGIGDAAGHAHRNLRAGDPGYFKLAHVAQYVSAVTGACLLVDKRKYLAVGGLDEESLPIAYNDVDLCLKLERAGWHNVYVPHAVLIHHESKSRAKDHSRGRVDAYKRELRTFQQRWAAESYEDPLMNPNLDRSNETFVIRF